jgi:hypothetical protein
MMMMFGEHSNPDGGLMLQGKANDIIALLKSHKPGKSASKSTTTASASSSKAAASSSSSSAKASSSSSKRDTAIPRPRQSAVKVRTVEICYSGTKNIYTTKLTVILVIH